MSDSMISEKGAQQMKFRDGEITAVVVVFVVVNMALIHRLTNRPTERQTEPNSAARPWKIRPRIGNMASQGRVESDKALSYFGDILGVKYTFFDR